MSGHTSEYALYEPVDPYPDQDHQEYEHTCTDKACNVGADLKPVRQKLFRPIRYICHFRCFLSGNLNICANCGSILHSAPLIKAKELL